MKVEIEKLIKKYEDKIKSARSLQSKGTGAFTDTPTRDDIKRLDIRIYERNTFINDLKELLSTI